MIRFLPLFLVVRQFKICAGELFSFTVSVNFLNTEIACHTCLLRAGAIHVEEIGRMKEIDYDSVQYWVLGMSKSLPTIFIRCVSPVRCRDLTYIQSEAPIVTNGLNEKLPAILSTLSMKKSTEHHGSFENQKSILYRRGKMQ